MSDSIPILLFYQLWVFAMGEVTDIHCCFWNERSVAGSLFFLFSHKIPILLVTEA